MRNFIKKLLGKTDVAVNHKQQGNAFLEQGKLLQAQQCYRQHIAEHPNDAEGYVNLGFVLNEQEDYAQAETVLKKAIALNPHNADAVYMLGIAYQRQEHFQEAIDCFTKALAVDPSMERVLHHLYEMYAQGVETQHLKKQLIDYANNHSTVTAAHYYAGCVEATDDRFAQSIEHFKAALALDNEDDRIWFQLGNSYQRDRQWENAIAAYKHTLLLNPNHVPAYNHLGWVLQDQGQFDEAVTVFQESVNRQEDAEIFNNIGACFFFKKEYEKAIIFYQKALSIAPESGGVYGNLGRVYDALCNYGKALACYEKALALGGGAFINTNNIANVLLASGRFEDAVEKYREALTLVAENDPMAFVTHSNVLFASTYGDYSQAAYLQEAHAYGKRASAQAVPYTSWQVDRKGERPLRVGFVSGDIRCHPVGFFLDSFLSKVDPQKVQFAVYATNQKADRLTDDIKSRCVVFRMIEKESDAQAAQLIHGDAIDVLIDLAGHTGGNRLSVFAWRPAPVQVSWLGYWASTGVEQMDYVLADRIALPAGDQHYFSEKIHYLPDTRMCFTQPLEDAVPAVASLPALKNGYITFGSFQNLIKINDQVLAVWARLFVLLPTARLRLQTRQFKDAAVRDHTFRRLKDAGIVAARVDLVAETSWHDYLASYGEIDVILDTFPFPGGTTTCEALWMGVPTLTHAGQTMIGRQGESMMCYAGLPEWVAHTHEEYVKKAVQLTADLEQLARLRDGLRSHVSKSALFDAQGFAHHFEEAIRDMWLEK